MLVPIPKKPPLAKAYQWVKANILSSYLGIAITCGFGLALIDFFIGDTTLSYFLLLLMYTYWLYPELERFAGQKWSNLSVGALIFGSTILTVESKVLAQATGGGGTGGGSGGCGGLLGTIGRELMNIFNNAGSNAGQLACNILGAVSIGMAVLAIIALGVGAFRSSRGEEFQSAFMPLFMVVVFALGTVIISKIFVSG